MAAHALELPILRLLRLHLLEAQVTDPRLGPLCFG